MKKQRQNISSSVCNDNYVQEASKDVNLGLEIDKNKLNLDTSSQTQKDFTLIKRERESGFSTENLKNSNEIKKQRIEQPTTNQNSIINNNNNLSVTDNQSSMFNIINNSNTGNINVNVNLNSFTNNHNPYANQNIYSGVATNNYRPSTNSTYNVYQNLSQGTLGGSSLNNNPNAFSYTSSFNGNHSTNKLIGNVNEYNMYTNPNRVGANTNYAGINVNGLINSSQTGIFNNSLEYGNKFNLNLKSTHLGQLVQTSEKKKYVIQDLPEMTVGNYLQNKNTKEMYLSSIKKENSTFKNVEEAFASIEQSTSSNSNNIVIQTKSVPAQLNKFSPAPKSQNLTKTVNFTTIGNVITFNKNPIRPVSLIESNSSNQINSGINNHEGITSTSTSTSKTFNSNFISSPMPNPKTNSLTKSNPNPKTASNPAAKPGEFSDSLQKYIQRAYEKCKNDFDRTKCQNALMKIMAAALKKGDLNTRNWNTHPLPIMPSELGQAVKIDLTENELTNREKRIDRFTTDYDNFTANSVTNIKESKDSCSTIEDLTKNIVIVGTCQTLDKQYLRLTTVPDPSQIRPENILQKSLKMLKDKWKNKQGDYNYISEQFRSIRQDMTIQHIQNEFTVSVYETHARIALESLDLDQFNQCQTALISLYDLNIKGRNIEFLAYRIIYTILQGIKYDMENLLKDVYSMEKKKEVISKHMEISHALKIMKAINTNNYFEFFKLYKIAPNMGSYLIEPFLPRLRIIALQIAAAGYYTEVNVDFLSDKLAFESVPNMVKFLEENEIVLSNDKKKILIKESANALNNSKLLVAKQFKISNIY